MYNYADDNTISKADYDLNTVIESLESDSLSLIYWFSDNKMKANPDATEGTVEFDELTGDYGQRYKKVSESFLNHRKLAQIVQRFNDLVNDDTSLPILPEQDPDGSNPLFDIDLSLERAKS